MGVAPSTPALSSPGACIAHNPPLSSPPPPSGWRVARAVLADAHLFDSLAAFDASSAAQVFPALQPFVCDPDFNPARVANVSQVAAQLCAWVLAVADCVPHGDRWAVTRQALAKDLEGKVDACALAQRRVEALEAAVQQGQ